jgi:hypothetical protein
VFDGERSDDRLAVLERRAEEALHRRRQAVELARGVVARYNDGRSRRFEPFNQRARARGQRQAPNAPSPTTSTASATSTIASHLIQTIVNLLTYPGRGSAGSRTPARADLPRERHDMTSRHPTRFD